VLIVGTGTAVGKTHVGCALLETWAELGIEVAGLKPVESGTADLAGRSDQARLVDASRAFHVKRGTSSTFHVKPSLYDLSEPVSPHLAARRAGIRLELSAIRTWVLSHAAPVVVVETAGGLFSPLTDEAVTNADLVTTLRPAALVLVAPDRLGVLHDLTATLGLAAARGLPQAAVVLSAPERADPSTGTNEAELARLGIATVIASFPRASPSDAVSREAAAALIRSLQANESGP
jgi:dethiobiotin synthetase